MKIIRRIILEIIEFVEFIIKLIGQVIELIMKVGMMLFGIFFIFLGVFVTAQFGILGFIFGGDVLIIVGLFALFSPGEALSS